jgi:hypothetical protein
LADTQTYLERGETVKELRDVKTADSAETVRNNLLSAARQAGPRYISVRGVDLETAITCKGPAEAAVSSVTDNKPTAGEKK